MEKQEIKELIISALVIALSFSIANGGGLIAFKSIQILAKSIVYSIVVVSLGFVLHEFGHRYTARKFGCYSEYKMWVNGLLLSLLGSLFGLFFAAPGAVVIHPRIDLWGRIRNLSIKEYGMIALSGPIINFIIALAFLLLYRVWIHPLFYAGAYINAFLGAFNLIPFPPLDGEKVFRWNKLIWITIIVLEISIIFLL